jgi:hypothetical protein
MIEPDCPLELLAALVGRLSAAMGKNRPGWRMLLGQRLLNSGVADATQVCSGTDRVLKPTAKVNLRYAARKTESLGLSVSSVSMSQPVVDRVTSTRLESDSLGPASFNHRDVRTRNTVLRQRSFRQSAQVGPTWYACSTSER